MKVLICDQFFSPTPYSLQKNPMKFEELCEEMLKADVPKFYRQPEAKEIDPATFSAEWATTVWKADENGMAKVFATNWDTSG